MYVLVEYAIEYETLSICTLMNSPIKHYQLSEIKSKSNKMFEKKSSSVLFQGNWLYFAYLKSRLLFLLQLTFNSLFWFSLLRSFSLDAWFLSLCFTFKMPRKKIYFANIDHTAADVKGQNDDWLDNKQTAFMAKQIGLTLICLNIKPMYMNLMSIVCAVCMSSEE